jgi:hypothetical protein
MRCASAKADGTSDLNLRPFEGYPMVHESLIDELAAGLKPVRRRRTWVDLVAVALICAAEIIVFFAVGAARPDMPMMMKQPTFWWRLASLGLIAGISGILAILSFTPTYSPRRDLRWVFLIVTVCLAAGLCLEGSPDEIRSVIRRIDWTDGVQCAGKMIALSIPPVLALGVLMCRGAPIDRVGTALLVGIAAAAWGAFVFVFACPFDDPLYIAVWYSVGCGTVILGTRAILPRLARW